MLRTLRTPFLDEWSTKPKEAARLGERLWDEMGARIQAGQRRETMVTASQTAGGIRGILPVAEIMRNLVTETEAALAASRNLF